MRHFFNWLGCGTWKQCQGNHWRLWWWECDWMMARGGSWAELMLIFWPVQHSQENDCCHKSQRAIGSGRLKIQDPGFTPAAGLRFFGCGKTNKWHQVDSGKRGQECMVRHWEAEWPSKGSVGKRRKEETVEEWGDAILYTTRKRGWPVRAPCPMRGAPNPAGQTGVAR